MQPHLIINKDCNAVLTSLGWGEGASPTKRSSKHDEKNYIRLFLPTELLIADHVCVTEAVINQVY